MTLILCCDEGAPDRYGKIGILSCEEGEEGPRGPPKMKRAWTDVTFIEMLRLVFESARWVMADNPECLADVRNAGSDESRATGGAGKWDVAWKHKYNTAFELYERLLARKVELPSRRRSDYMD